jgi:hypothetical protein
MARLIRNETPFLSTNKMCDLRTGGRLELDFPFLDKRDRTSKVYHIELKCSEPIDRDIGLLEMFIHGERKN